MLYIGLHAFGLLLGLAIFSGYASASCNIVDTFTTDSISAFYETIIPGRGCVTNLTNSNSQEVHAINLLNVGPVFRNDVAEVNLFIKSRKGEVLWEPVIFILNSQHPVRWRVRVTIFSPDNKRHVFVIPRYSAVKLKKNRRRQIRKIDAIPSDSQEFVNWVQRKYGVISSFTEIKRGNRMMLTVGVDQSNPSECEIQSHPNKLSLLATYEEPQFLSGCSSDYAKNPVARLAYIIELDRVHISPNANVNAEVELDIRSSSQKDAETNFFLVLKSPKDVTWKVKTRKLDGYIDVVATSFVDMKEIRMDTVGVRTEDIAVTKQALIQWVNDFIGKVGMYTHIALANKIKLVLPDTAPVIGTSRGKGERVNRINIFQNPNHTISVLRKAMHTQCMADGNLVVALKKSVVKKYFGMKKSQLTLSHTDCVARENKTDFYIWSMANKCGTKITHKKNKLVYSNTLIVHSSNVGEAIPEVGSGGGVDDTTDTDDDDDPIEGSGTGSPNLPMTFIDDEDYQKSGNIKVDFECETLQTSEVTTPIQPIVTNTPYYNHNIHRDVTFQMELYRSQFFVDPNYRFPMSVAANKKVFVKASLNADHSLDVIIEDCWLSPNMDNNEKKQIMLIKDGCLQHSSVKWVKQNRILSEITQSKRFSFHAINSYPFSFLKCQLRACRHSSNIKYNYLPQCQTQEKVCNSGPQPTNPRVPSKLIVLGPMYTMESTATPPGDENPIHPAIGDPVNVRTKEPPHSGNSQSGTSNQTIIVEGLDSGTVVGIAFAAFIIGVLLMAALWFIHRHTGPVKHAMVSRSALDGSGESTPMSTAPLQINS